MLAMKYLLLTSCTGLLLPSLYAQEHPNVIVIMCDDMGFSDIGCYGGEVRTPNINALAENGIRFTQFKNTGRSCPSRASLLTGRYPHSVGVGWMTAVDEHREAYRGQLSDKYPTIAEIFRKSGYRTYMSGKWHVTLDFVYNGKEDFTLNGSFPIERGFDKYFGAISGGGSYYKPEPLMIDDKLIKEYPDDFYYTDAITDNAVRFIKDHDTSKPMFLYVAHYAPHRPLQAPKIRVEDCAERYQVGYDVLKRERFRRQQTMGIIPSSFKLPLHNKEFKDNSRPSWESLSQNDKKRWIQDMSTYAAMIEIVDDGVGLIMNALKEKGMFDNTVIIFLSDNGATIEGGKIAQYTADLSNTPYRSYKKWCYMGGTSSPLIIHYPQKYARFAGELRTDIAHIMDILPTCLDIADLNYPKEFKGNAISNCEGTSLTNIIENRHRLKGRDIFFEHQTSCAVISDNWKLVKAKGCDKWQLVDLSKDPFEEYDLSIKFPDKVKDLERKWEKWADEHNVLPFEYKVWTDRINFYFNKNSDQDGID